MHLRALRATAVSGLVITLVVGIGSALFAAPTGSGRVGAKSRAVVTNLSGEFSATTNLDHYAQPGTRRATAILDVVDPAVTEASVRVYTACDTNSGTSTDSVNRTDLNVSGSRKAKVRIKLPNNHQGCDVTAYASVSYTSGPPYDDALVTVKKLVLTLGA